MLKIAVSSRALFNLEDGNRIFEEKGFKAFDSYMRENEHKPLRPGVIFHMIRKLLLLNTEGEPPRVEVTLLSSNTLEAGARIMNSIMHYGLNIRRAFFTSGGDRMELAKAAGIQLFLSTNQDQVLKSLASGIAGATILPTAKMHEDDETSSVCLVFDGDSVLFSDEAEIVNQIEGFNAFIQSEQAKESLPLGDGPFRPVLEALHEIQTHFKDIPKEERPLRVALVTARGVQVYSRVVKTFRLWGVDVDEAMFCDGHDKGPILAALKADIFLDDGMHNIISAMKFVPSAHVPHGIQGRKAIPATS